MEVVSFKNVVKTKWGVMGVLSAAHLINDMYANFLPQIIPFLILGGVVTVTTGATLVAAFSITSSLVQPIFGYLVDQKEQRWLVYVGTLWMGIFLGLTGYINYYPLLLIVSALSGLGTAAFHPQAAAMIGHIGGKRSGFVLAAFVAVGNIGIAISPLLLLNMFNHFGIKSTWIAVIPAVVATLILYFFAPSTKVKKTSNTNLTTVLTALKKSSKELAKLVIVVSIRSLVNTGVTMLVPLYLLQKKLSTGHVSLIMFATLIAGSIGGLIGGYISDKYGRRPIVFTSLALSGIFLLGFLYTDGILAFILLVLGGMVLLSTFSITVAAAQSIIPENKAIASGLSLGFAIGLGGLAVTPLGKYAEMVSIESALKLAFSLTFVAAIIALSLKDEKNID